MISYSQAVVIGLLQGVTELFPVSSLGHSVLLPALLGWNDVLRDQSAQESPYLAFLVGLHVATALALLVFFRADWARILRGLRRSAARRRVETADERLGWLLLAGTIPAGLVGLAFEHTLRTLFAKPLAAAVFLTANGAILLAGERLRRRADARGPRPGTPAGRGDRTGATAGAPSRTAPPRPAATGVRRLASLTLGEAVQIGSAQILAFFAGISRSGVTMVAGLLRGLDHEDAARFSFLLATPIILAAGVYKLPDLLGPNGDGVRGQVLLGSLAAGVAAYLSVRFLTRWFTTRTLTPFAVYCLVVGIACIARFA
ncbi:MAG TPA: undecaprenyl-diphosphate phosphatase [Actinomycetes bacterium]|nr:undecaprenyl-diphosphate phosphatase [Actinomycetes bacterium]